MIANNFSNKCLICILEIARNTATVGSDANGNITSVNEAWTGTANTWKTDFTFDYENRLTKLSISVVAGGQTVVCNSISHAYDGLNRLIKTTAGSNYGHVYDGNKLAGNTNLTTSTDGTAWVNSANAAKPLASTQIQTVGATRYYNVSDERDPVRQVYTDAGTAGDTSQKSRYAEYKLIDGSAPTMVAYGGAIKQSELFRVRNITLNENSIVLPSANGSFEAAAISLNFEGTRVKSALIGRDLNPMGRGDGIYYFAGAMRTGATLPNIGYNHKTGSGNSVNNAGQKIGCPCPGTTSTNPKKAFKDCRTGSILPDVPCDPSKPFDPDKGIAAVVCCAWCSDCCPEEGNKARAGICGRYDEIIDKCCDQTNCGVDDKGNKIQPVYGPNCPKPKDCSQIDKDYQHELSICNMKKIAKWIGIGILIAAIFIAFFAALIGLFAVVAACMKLCTTIPEPSSMTICVKACLLGLLYSICFLVAGLVVALDGVETLKWRTTEDHNQCVYAACIKRNINARSAGCPEIPCKRNRAKKPKYHGNALSILWNCLKGAFPVPTP